MVIFFGATALIHKVDLGRFACCVCNDDAKYASLNGGDRAILWSTSDGDAVISWRGVTTQVFRNQT